MRGALAVLLAGLALAQDTAKDALAEKSRQARVLLESRHYAEAAVLYEELAKAIPGNAGLWLNTGMARFQAAEYDKAAAALETAVKLNPNLAPAQLVLGLNRLKMGEPARAIGPLEIAARLDPKNSIARSELAGAYLEAGRHDEAVKAYAALEGNKAILGRGYALLGVAERAAMELERRSPQSDWLRQLRERARAAAENQSLPPLVPPAPLPALLADRRPLPASLYWRAVAANLLATEAMIALAGTPEALELEAEALRSQGRHRDAAAKWEAAAALSPQDSRLRKRQAQSLWQAGEFDAAGGVLAGLPEDGDVLFLLGDLAQRRDDSAAARTLWERGARLSPTAKPMRAALGKLLLEANEAAAAIPHLEAARGFEPAVLFQLSRAYSAVGRKQAAAQALRQFQLEQSK